MPPETGFLEKLRMNSIFPSDGGTPFGMPDLSQGQMNASGLIRQILPIIQSEKEKERQFQREMRQPVLQNPTEYLPMGGGGNLNNIGSSMKNPDMKYVWDRSNEITPYQKESLAVQKASLASRDAIGKGGLDIKEKNADTAVRRAQLQEKIATGRASDAEKHEFRMLEINERGDIGSRQIGERGDITSGQIGERGDIQKELTGMRGQQQLTNIGANIAGRKELQDTRLSTIKPISPSQQGNLQENAVREMMVSRPDLGQFIEQDTNGQFRIKPNTPLNELSMIKSIIYPTGDVNLPSSGTSASTIKKPTTASKYQIAIE